MDITSCQGPNNEKFKLDPTSLEAKDSTLDQASRQSKLTRVRRFIFLWIRRRPCYWRCLGWLLWRRYCFSVCYCVGRRNNGPTITCPTIQDKYTDKGQTKAFIHWPPATATDPEDGNIRTRQTRGPLPHSLLGKGTYTVSYQAKDRQGSTATCSVTFSVKVRTCPQVRENISNPIGPFFWFPNGNIFCSHNNIYGSVCTFSCHPNYKLSGASKVECQEKGLWKPERPTCNAQECPVPSSVLNGQWTACSRHTVGSTCTLNCDQGYNIIDNILITCQSDLTWTTPGSCQDSEAPQINCPSNISVFALPKKQPAQVSWETPEATDNSGEVITVTSSHQSGDLFPVGNSIVVFYAEDKSGNVAVCPMVIGVKVKFCSPLQAPSEGQVSCTYDNAIGSECTFTCPQGYDLIGISRTSCLSSQVWNNDQPSCKKKSCGSPADVLKGSFACQEGHSYEATCSLRCDVGYVAVPPLAVTCGSMSSWSAAGSCMDTEGPKFPKGCPNVSRFASTFGEPTYVMYPTPEVTDNSGDRVAVTADIISGSEFPVGFTNVTFTAVDTSGKTATCILTVNVIKIECPHPVNTDIDDSKNKVMEFSCPDGHAFGTSCDIQCPDDSPLTGSSNITCMQNGTSTGYWMYGDVKPSCNAKTCPVPEPPTDGSIACDFIGNKEFCVVFCHQGYSFAKMDLQNGGFICLPSIGQWIPRPITSRICTLGRPASGAKVMPDIYFYSNSCSSDSEEIKRKFIAILDSTSIFKDVCNSKNGSCAVESVTVKLGSRGIRLFIPALYSLKPLRSKRDVDSATHKTTITFTVTISYDGNDIASQTSEFYSDMVFDLNERLNEAVKAGIFNISEIGETHEYSYGNAVEEFICPSSTLFQALSGMCAGCGQGYIYVSQSEPCTVCPVGTYQPEDEGTECLPCPDGFTTKTDAIVMIV